MKACRDQQNEYWYRNSTAAAAAHQIRERTTTYLMETNIMEVEKVQSRSASVVHRNGQNVSPAQATAAVPGSIASFFLPSCTNHMCASRCRGFHSRRPSIFQPPRLPLRSAQQYRYAHILQPRRLMLRPSQHSSWSAASQRARTSRALRNRGKLPYTLSHPLLPAWSVAAKTCNCFYLTRYDHTQQDLFEITVITPHVITPLRYTTRGGE